jgi:hypothetical protein
MKKANLTEYEALKAYAKMLNTFDTKHIEHLLADDFRFTSQQVLTDIVGKEEYLDYMKGKLLTLASRPENTVFAEMANINSFTGDRACIVAAQGSKDHLVATILCKVNDDKLVEVDMCIIPTPQSAIRSGFYPVSSDQ